jgi:predicted Zn-dependent protease with MMP-like domain
MRDWKDSMVLSDTGVPRWAEDLYDALPLEVRNAVDPVTKNAIADKKAQRQLRPV